MDPAAAIVVGVLAGLAVTVVMYVLLRGHDWRHKVKPVLGLDEARTRSLMFAAATGAVVYYSVALLLGPKPTCQADPWGQWATVAVLVFDAWVLAAALPLILARRG